MKIQRLRAAGAALALAALAAGPGSAASTKVVWHGHAAFEITTPKGKVLFIDPWLANPLNPAAKDGKNPLAAVAKADYLLLTHGHFDHIGDAVALARKTGARLVAGFELSGVLVSDLGFPKDQTGFETMINPGGVITIADGEVTVAMTPAVHSSGVATSSGTLYGGAAGGFVLKIKDGPTIYDTGDTAYFGDMALIGEQYEPDLALVNIGGHFGMEPDMAAKAAQTVRAKLVVPQHYGTFPALVRDAQSFFAKLDGMKIAHLELVPGGAVEFQGRELSAVDGGRNMKTYKNEEEAK